MGIQSTSDADNNLLRRARGRDQAALSDIHDQYYDAIYRYFVFRVPDMQTAEDLAGEVFVRFLSAIRDRANPPNTLRGWLYGASANVLKEHYRKQARMPMTELGDTVPDIDLGPEFRLETKQGRAELRAALSDLTEEQQNVLALRFGFGLPIKEVAELIHKSEGSVKMLQARAIMNLTQRLAPGGGAR